MQNTNQDQIFISYHSSKIDLVEHLSKYLERNDIKTWYAPRNIRSGEQWDESINNAIKHCKAFVLLFCEKADESIQVKRELSLADKYKKPVFWLRVERVEPNNLSYFLTSTQWLDWMDIRDVTLESLVRDLKTLEVTNKYDNINSDIDILKPISREKKWVKGVLAFDNDREAAECAARVYFNLAQSNPDSSIILPTGRSGTAIFRAMLRIADEYEGCPFGEAMIMSDTETFGVWMEHETSRTKHINEKLIEPLKEINKAPSKQQLNLLTGIYTDNDPIKKAQKLLREYPPVVHAVSISPVGEILAYEVGTYTDIDDIIDDGPKIVEVGEHSKKYIDPNQPSKSIITVGLGTVMSSKILLILVFDLQKANALKRMFNGPMTAGIPATILRNHSNAYVLTTNDVAKEAGLTDDLLTKNLKPKEATEWIIKR